MADQLILTGLWMLFAFVIHLDEASRITLTASPTVIIDGISNTLKLRCSLENTETSTTIIGRDLSSTDFDVHHVNSIVVSRGRGWLGEREEPIATIIMSQTPVALGDQNNLQVAGDLSLSNPSISRYLELTWTRPGSVQSNCYTCEINALDFLGHAIKFTANISIDFESPTDENILAHIVTLKDNIDFVQRYLNNLDVGFHNEGIVEFAISTCMEEVKEVRFSRKYTSPPQVNIGVIAEVYDNDAAGGCQGLTGYRFSILNVTTESFTIWFTPYINMGIVQLRWTSLPTPVIGTSAGQ